VLEVSKKASDEIARHKLNKKDNENLFMIELLRGLGKWTARDGITVTAGKTFLSPSAGLITCLLSERFFVLINPEEISEMPYNGNGE